MRHAGPVSLQCPGRAWGLVQAWLFALTAAVLAAWLLALAQLPGWGQALAAGTVAVLVWLAAARHRSAPAPTLAWDGQVWLLDGEPAQVRLSLDARSLLLLQLRLAAGGQRWLGIAKGEAGPAWHGLRVALYAHARVDGAGAPAEGLPPVRSL